MKALHLSDLHIVEGDRLDEQRAVLEDIVSWGESEAVDVWLLSGDLTGRTVPHRATPAERLVLYGALARMTAVAPVLIVPGNHDEARDLLSAQHVGLSIVDGGCWPVVVLDGAGSRSIETPAGPLWVYHLGYPTKRWLLAGQETSGAARSQAAVEARLQELLELWAVEEAARRADPAAAPSVLIAHAAVVGARLSGGEVLATQEIGVQQGAIARLMDAGVDYGALGHLHLRQEVAPRAWYVGSPWRTDFGEREPSKFVHLVDLQAREVQAARTSCAWLETLDYRWSAATEDGVPSWTLSPTDEQLARVPGAEVRARLVVPQQHVASCPWDEVLRGLEARGARRIRGERTVEPVLRVRAPEVASAVSLDAKVGAYWTTLGTEVPDADRSAALELLGELLTLDDEAIVALDDAGAPA